MTRNDDAVRLAIEADIALVVRGIAKKDAQGGAGGKFVGSGGGEIGIARAPEDAEMVIGWLNTEEGKAGGGKRKCFGGNDIEKVCCHAKGSSPKGGWYTCMEEQGVNNIVNAANDAFGFTVLCGGVGTRHPKENAMVRKE
jgi:hypothetical protein